MTIRALVVAALLCAVAPPAAGQDFRAGWLAYQRGDFAAAAEAWRRQAREGHAQSQFMLGELYRTGKGVLQSHGQAVKWYRLAAEQGYDKAQNNLAGMYCAGLGVPVDYAACAEWASRAARQGNAWSQAKMGALHASGRGVKRDLVLAYAWHRLAARQGAEGSRKAIDESEPSAFVHLMTDAELAEARRLVAGWQRGRALSREGAPARPRQVTAARPGASTASGFVVSPDGLVVTNHHVVEGCRTVTVDSRRATVRAVHRRNDLAVLETQSPAAAFAKLRWRPDVQLGEDIIVAGFPLHGLLSSGLNVTKGIVSALMGLGNDRRYFQITAPVQKGNSGGPVLDGSGHVVGVVASKLNALRAAERAGVFPENVNFAVSGDELRAFLGNHGVAFATADSGKVLATVDIASLARGFTVMVRCER